MVSINQFIINVVVMPPGVASVAKNDQTGRCQGKDQQSRPVHPHQHLKRNFSGVFCGAFIRQWWKRTHQLSALGQPVAVRLTGGPRLHKGNRQGLKTGP